MIPLFKVFMPASVDKPLLETLHSGYITEGPKVKAFEVAFGERITNPQVVAVNSGTSALTLALRLAGVGPGDEVVTTPMTCTATNLPILSLGARPVWADVNPVTGLIDPADVERKVTSRTRAIMCVDWGGMPCDLKPLLLKTLSLDRVCLIEDAAHSLGASYRGLPVGCQTLADFTCFSLQAIKHITTVDGGMLAVGQGNAVAYERGRWLRWFGIDREAPTAGDSRINVDISEWGWKFHMNDVTATIGLEQLTYLDMILAKYRRNARFYHNELSAYYILPLELPEVDSAYWLYTILLPNRDARDRFRQFMLNRGIQVSQVHRRNDDYTVFEPFKSYPMPGVDNFSERMICIPVHWALTFSELTYIVETCNEFARGEI